MLNKIFYVDCETTGLDPVKNGIWQMSAHIVVDGVEVKKLKWDMQPLPGKICVKAALDVGNVTVDDLRGFQPPHAVYKELIAELKLHVNKFDKKDKFWFVGYNAAFDYQFIRQWFDDLGDKYFGSWFWFPYIDVMQLAAFVLAPVRPELVNFKLATVMGYFKREFLAHDAENDLVETRWLFEHFEQSGLVMHAPEEIHEAAA